MIAAGIIGWPVAHSKSPLIHRFWLAKLGIDGDYSRFAVAPQNLGEAIRALPKLGLAGVNVTVPHKVAVIPHLDRLDPLAERVGAVNTIVIDSDGISAGHNTDVIGFAEPLAAVRTKSGPPFEGYWHIIVGAGGAARAVLTALSDGEGVIYNRDPKKADALIAEFGLTDRFLSSLPLTRLGSVQAVASRPGILINTTILGMVGQPELPIIDLDLARNIEIVYDLVYAPLETPLLKAARLRGLRTIDGLQMLVAQAAAAFALFYGQPAPREHDAELRALLTA